jgi:hypothetical protein
MKFVIGTIFDLCRRYDGEVSRLRQPQFNHYFNYSSSFLHLVPLGHLGLEWNQWFKKHLVIYSPMIGHGALCVWEIYLTLLLLIWEMIPVSVSFLKLIREGLNISLKHKAPYQSRGYHKVVFESLIPFKP